MSGPGLQTLAPGGIPEDAPGWFKDYVALQNSNTVALNAALKTMATAEVVEVSYVGGSGNLDVKCGTIKRPKSVVAAGVVAEDETGASDPTVHVGPMWKPAGDFGFRVTSFFGLTSDKRYRISLLVVG